MRDALAVDVNCLVFEMEAALIEGLCEGGLDVVRIGMGPSPMLYFATYYLDVDGGIQVTGSHNPADYNGFKLLLKGRSVFGQEIQGIGERAALGNWCEGTGGVEEVDVRAAYVDRLLEDLPGGAAPAPPKSAGRHKGQRRAVPADQEERPPACDPEVGRADSAHASRFGTSGRPLCPKLNAPIMIQDGRTCLSEFNQPVGGRRLPSRLR